MEETFHILFHLLTYQTLVELLKIAVRGELIVSKHDYKNYSSKYKNPRNFANSMCVAKSHDNLALLNFVAFDLVSPRMKTIDGF